MKLYTCLLLFFTPFLLFGQGRERAMDGVIHLEDSIYLSVPQLPRLCDTMPLEKRMVDIGDCRLFVETEGEGVPIVLINGGPGGTHHYFHPWFSRLKEGHKVIYYDQRGTGRSDFKPGDGYSFRQAVDDLEKLRINLGISRWVVCGFSYGGGLAQLYTATHPERVLGMVLISSLPLIKNEVLQGEQQKYISEREEEMRKRIIREYVNGNLSMEAFLYNLALNGDWKRQYYYKPGMEEMIRSARYGWVNDTDFNSVMSEDYGRYNLSGVFDNCPIPTVILEGNNDLTWGPQKAMVLKENHPNARFFSFDRAAHSLYKDVPEKFFASLIDFTNSLSTPSLNTIREWQVEIEDKLLPGKIQE